MKFKVYHNEDFKPKLNLNKKKTFWTGVVVLLIILFIVSDLGIALVSEYIWMDSLGFSDVFVTIFSARILLFAVGFLLFSCTLFLTLLGIRRAYVRNFQPDELPFVFRHSKLFFLSSWGLSFLYGLIGSSIVQGLGWERFLTYQHQVPFQVSDPVFGHDVAFYVYTLPFWNFVVSSLLGLIVVILIIQGSAYGISKLYWTDWGARVQLMLSVLLFGVVLGAKHFLGRYDTLLSDTINGFQQKSVVYGVSYTDAVINIPLAYVLAALPIISALAVIAGLSRRNWRLLVAGPALYVIVLLFGQLAAWGVQQFMVTPNEFHREEPYLEHNLIFTRQAYGLDNINQQVHPGTGTISGDLVERNSLTLDNVRINDARPLLDVYNQIQSFRTYYQFNDVDVDRYMIDGEYQQVFIGARELNTDQLPSQAQTWVNRTLRYTHGYGIAASHVNEVTPQGQPEFLVKNLPPEGSPEITRPQIYFGEQVYPHVIINTKVDEFNYPEGESNVTYRYTADTGIPMTRLNRFIYAWEEGSPRIFISGLINQESQLLRKRNIMERLNAIAPFLTYDQDPYIVVRDDGTLIWIVDAYTTTRQYPYAEPVGAGFNYIRNPIKAVVDAYTGEVHFYVVDPDDPLWQTYANIFPDLFTEEIPEDIQAHFRYPVNMFTYQAEIFRTYHMSDLEVFYNREDMWAFPTEKYYDQDIIMEPYYITMQLPDEEREEFILMQPFTPNNRQNMIAWLAARNDGENYGELLLYRFPKQRTVYGPQQIENRINQDPYISQQLNLWSQGGSRTIRGNLLVIPIEDTLLYVEPVYIESDSRSSLPEVGKIIVAYQDYIVMEDTFAEAIERLVEMEAGAVRPDGAQPGQDEQTPLIVTAESLVEQLADLFESYRNAMAAGQWEQAGRMMTEIEKQLADWKRQQGGGETGSDEAAETDDEEAESATGQETEVE
ncbi:uncharacterized membrane protein (UPF0182 family) [Caldalkalibacillus uzonensis]|uniref:UPF0182 protein J2S00_000128 n=1 Tax=Caldalkalibacillus uzonensis TaxID=353224 RepID=A0ABU0CLR1_9BACI|nr:UPF0182 family protein [Caldalkalibacillus uzonensis]MDQ0337358.1 uncharacterized membrane protein (UPF0182 family) [Caldalkalibacillus uzonensis]